jgi:hypothetical protein
MKPTTTLGLSSVGLLGMIRWGMYPNVENNKYSYTEGEFESVDLSTCRLLTQKQILYAYNNIPKFYKLDEEKVNALILATKTASFFQLTVIAQLLPMYTLGYYPATPLPSIRALNRIAYGTGSTGWSWYIAYFPEQNLQIFVSVSRFSPANPSIVKDMNLTNEQASFYSLDCSIGQGTSFERTSVVLRGDYRLTDKGYWLTLTSPDIKDCLIQWTSPDTFGVKVGWKDNLINVVFNSTHPPNPVNNEGCLCVNGIGTPYYSYPKPRVTGDVTFKGQKINPLDGEGWIDRQMGGGSGTKGFVIGAVLSGFQNKLGLGPYIWSNIHFPGRKYMLFTGLTSIPEVNDVLSLTVIKYVDGDVGYGLTANAKVLHLENGMPVKYKITIQNEDVFVITSIGLPIYTDITGNRHAAGVGTITHVNGSVIPNSWGFLESSGMDDPKTIMTNALTASGVLKTDWNIWFKTNYHNRIIFTLSLILTGIFILGIILSIIKLIRQRKRKRR